MEGLPSLSRSKVIFAGFENALRFQNQQIFFEAGEARDSERKPLRQSSNENSLFEQDGAGGCAV